MISRQSEQEIKLEMFDKIIRNRTLIELSSMDYLRYIILVAERRLRIWRTLGCPSGYFIGCPCDACRLCRVVANLADRA